MRRTLKTLSPCLVAFLLMLTVAFAGNAQELQKKLEGLKGISGIEKLESDHYAEKYLVRITQPVDHKNPAAGTFTQRVIVAHVGFDRPTILVTEGYGAAYALNPRYQEELSKLLDANMVFVEYRYFLASALLFGAGRLCCPFSDFLNTRIPSKRTRWHVLYYTKV